MGPDGHHPRFLKETSEIICEPLEIILDKSYQSGEVPKIWKDAFLSIIYKNNSNNVVTSIVSPIKIAQFK